MGYKANFAALEIYKAGQWVALGDPADHSAALHPLSIEPIAEQVAHIALPPARQE
jgi:arginine-tRNA-protein transferase